MFCKHVCRDLHATTSCATCCGILNLGSTAHSLLFAVMAVRFLMAHEVPMSARHLITLQHLTPLDQMWPDNALKHTQTPWPQIECSSKQKWLETIQKTLQITTQSSSGLWVHVWTVWLLAAEVKALRVHSRCVTHCCPFGCFKEQLLPPLALHTYTQRCPQFSHTVEGQSDSYTNRFLHFLKKMHDC